MGRRAEARGRGFDSEAARAAGDSEAGLEQY